MWVGPLISRCLAEIATILVYIHVGQLTVAVFMPNYIMVFGSGVFGCRVCLGSRVKTHWIRFMEMSWHIQIENVAASVWFDSVISTRRVEHILQGIFTWKEASLRVFLCLSFKKHPANQETQKNEEQSHQQYIFGCHQHVEFQDLCMISLPHWF